MLILRGQRNAQPATLVGVNRANRLAANAKMLLLPINGRLIDVADPSQVWTPASTAAVSPTAYGNAAVMDKGDNSYWSITGYSSIVGAYGTFAVWVPRLGLSDSNGAIFLSTSSVFFQLSATAQYSFGAQCASGVSYFSTANTSFVFTANAAASSQKLYVKGARAPGTVSGTPTAWAAGPKSMTFGRYVSNTAYGVDGDVCVALYTSDVWTEADALSFHMNPWQVFAPHRIYIPTYAAAAGGAPTLSDLQAVSVTSSSVQATYDYAF